MGNPDNLLLPISENLADPEKMKYMQIELGRFFSVQCTTIKG